jgi:serine protease
MKRVVALAVLTGAFLLSLQTGSAQQSVPYPLRASPDRVRALVQAWNDGLPYVPGEVLVKFRPGAAAGRASVLSLLRGAAATRQETWIGDTLLVRSTADPESPAVAFQLAQQPEVEWAQPNYLLRTGATPTDPSYFRQWNMDAIRMPEAWDINPGAGPAVTVAIIDTGVTAMGQTLSLPLWTGSAIETVTVPVAANPDIAGGRFVPGVDFVFWTGPVIDFDGHGTHVAGTALQETNNAVGLAGIAYRARVMPLKVCLGYWDLQFMASASGVPGFIDPDDEGFCPLAEILQAMRYAVDNGARVLNLSLSAPFPLQAWADTMRYVVDQGGFLSVAAGNSFEEGNPVEYPAGYANTIDGAMAVGAVGRSRIRSYFSNTGPHIEIVAPGGDVRAGGLPGVIYQSGLFFPDYDPVTVTVPRFDRYVDVPSQGTSMAAPHVAGLAALLHAQGITRPAAIEAAIKAFATDLGAPGRDDQYGHGLIDARTSLRGRGAAR